MSSRFKLFSDPVHGFISVPKGLILRLVQTPEFQRLRRIRQLGVGNLVFPGAEHTRFGHGLGAMALMQEALQTLSEKGTPIDAEEHRAALIAALLHDVGHGPFSHSLEDQLIPHFEHEWMSRELLVRLNRRFDGELERALAMFDNRYPRPFFHQLVSSQLDMDRLDYLRRDAHFTGVVEGRVGVERIIKTLRVDPIEGGSSSELVIEEKGSYAVESFLLSRRLMYWQVYLHKTVLAGDHLLRSIVQRTRRLLREGRTLPPASPSLMYFLRRTVRVEDVSDPEVVAHYCRLDDTDVLYSLKQWMRAEDPLLADLCRRFIERDFFRVTFLDADPSDDLLDRWKNAVSVWMHDQGLIEGDDILATQYYLQHATSRHAAYAPSRDSIHVLTREGKRRELSALADTQAITAIARTVIKPYLCHPKEVSLPPVPTPTGT